MPANRKNLQQFGSLLQQHSTPIDDTDALMEICKTSIIIRELGKQDYLVVWQAMKDLTQQRNELQFDEIWLLEHFPIFTQGQNGKSEHLLNPGDIPVLQVDRGGQITYHGPGQLVVYILLDIRRRGISIRQLVSTLEQAVINLLADYDIKAIARHDAPGVYVEEAKIASIGLRVRKGCSYHGLSFNIAMDLEPFTRINPCGFRNLSVTQLQQLGGPTNLQQVGKELISHFCSILGYHTLSYTTEWHSL